MKRGSFLKTTVATGLMVAGLMTVGRAGLKSPGFLFLAGQLKIAAGDTDSGMRLLARAASGPEFNSNSMLASEKPSVVVDKPCTKASPAPVVRKPKATEVKVNYAPEPTMAWLASPHIPMPPLVQPALYSQGDPMAYVSHEQIEAIRAQQAEMKKVLRVREMNTKKLLHEISVKYGPNTIPDTGQIRMQVQKGLGAWDQ